jgi:hypothetical protein
VNTTIHCHVDVKGALLAPLSEQRRVYRTLSRDGKRLASVDEYRALLADLLAEGVLCLPVGTRCEGFSDTTGCPGHPTEPA